MRVRSFDAPLAQWPPLNEVGLNEDLPQRQLQNAQAEYCVTKSK